jgi:hypothetical protein
MCDLVDIWHEFLHMSNVIRPVIKSLAMSPSIEIFDSDRFHFELFSGASSSQIIDTWTLNMYVCLCVSSDIIYIVKGNGKEVALLLYSMFSFNR